MENEKVLEKFSEAVEAGTDVATEVAACPIKCAFKAFGTTLIIGATVVVGAKVLWDKFGAPKFESWKEKRAAKKNVADVETEA